MSKKKCQRRQQLKASSPLFNLAQYERKPYFLPALGLCGLLMCLLLFDANLSLTGDNSLCEVIEHGKSGYLIPRYDTDAFAKQILQLTSTPVNREIGRKARENVLAKCDYRLVASQYEAFFEKVKNN